MSNIQQVDWAWSGNPTAPRLQIESDLKDILNKFDQKLDKLSDNFNQKLDRLSDDFSHKLDKLDGKVDKLDGKVDKLSIILDDFNFPKRLKTKN